jgi:hypothetical protein
MNDRFKKELGGRKVYRARGEGRKRWKEEN